MAGFRAASIAALMVAAVALAACGTSANTTTTSTSHAVPAATGDAATPEPVTAAAPTTTASTTHNAAKATTATVDQVITTDGVSQYLHCGGSGPVTVVVVAGLHADSSSWSAVRPDLERLTRTCVYDRPGLGRSPARTDGRITVDARLYANELAALLSAAGEKGPFIVVGHSFGGLVARAFVREHLTSVKAVFLAESVTPHDPTLGDVWHEAGLDVDMTASSDATGNGPHLGSLPLLVMTASRPDADHLTGPTYGQGDDVTAEWLRGQAANLNLSTDAIQVVAHSGHVLQQDSPAAVVEGVRELLTAVKTGAPLTCAPVWATLNATCHSR